MEDETQVNAGETDGTGAEEEVQTTSTESGDPLDSISDPEELRNRAKGYRSERNKFRKDFVELKENASVPNNPLDKPLTRGELVKDAEKKGLALAPEGIKANKDKLLPYYRADYGGDIPTPEQVAKRWKQAELLYKDEHPDEQNGDAGLQLQTDTGSAPAGKQPTQAKEPEADWFEKGIQAHQPKN